jgi:hypothetical protein
MIMEQGIKALSRGCTVIVPEGSALCLFAGEEEGLITYQREKEQWGEGFSNILADCALWAQRGQRGAEKMHQEFGTEKMARETFRLAVFLASRSRQKKDKTGKNTAHDLRRIRWGHNSHTSFSSGAWLTSNYNLSLLSRQLLKENSLEVRLEMGREFLLTYADIKYRGLYAERFSQNSEFKLVESTLNVLSQGLKQFANSLILRFNLIRTAFHFGQPEHVGAALNLAHHTLDIHPAEWQVDPQEDILPWDFFNAHFNYRDYLKLATKSLGESRQVEKVILVRMIQASLRHYVSHYEDAVENSSKAVALDRDFPPYKMRLAKLLIERGGKNDVKYALSLLVELLQDTFLFTEAMDLIGQVDDRTIVDTEAYSRIQAACKRYQFIQSQSGAMAGGLRPESWRDELNRLQPAPQDYKRPSNLRKLPGSQDGVLLHKTG